MRLKQFFVFLEIGLQEYLDDINLQEPDRKTNGDTEEAAEL